VLPRGVAGALPLPAGQGGCVVALVVALRRSPSCRQHGCVAARCAELGNPAGNVHRGRPRPSLVPLETGATLITLPRLGQQVSKSPPSYRSHFLPRSSLPCFPSLSRASSCPLHPHPRPRRHPTPAPTLTLRTTTTSTTTTQQRQQRHATRWGGVRRRLAGGQGVYCRHWTAGVPLLLLPLLYDGHGGRRRAHREAGYTPDFDLFDADAPSKWPCLEDCLRRASCPSLEVK
jgi:hypothetical protein